MRLDGWLCAASVCVSACGRIGFDDRITLVQQAAKPFATSSTVTVDLAADVGFGDLLVLTVSTDTMIDGIASVSGGGVQWTEIAAVAGLGSICTPCIRGAMWYGPSSTGASRSVTVDFFGSDDSAVSITEWSSAGRLDGMATNGPGTTAVTASGSVAVPRAGELVVAMVAADMAAVATGPTNGFVALRSPPDGQALLASASLIAPEPGSFGTSWTLSLATQAWIGIVAAFAPG